MGIKRNTAKTQYLCGFAAFGEAKGDDGWHKKQEQITAYLGPALEIMFERQGTDHFSGE